MSCSTPRHPARQPKPCAIFQHNISSVPCTPVTPAGFSGPAYHCRTSCAAHDHFLNLHSIIEGVAPGPREPVPRWIPPTARLNPTPAFTPNYTRFPRSGQKRNTGGFFAISACQPQPLTLCKALYDKGLSNPRALITAGRNRTERIHCGNPTAMSAISTWLALLRF